MKKQGYDPSTLETRWYQNWERNNYFAAKGQGKPYCIAMPPPNVTGTLHMGHGFQISIMDALIRYHRMRGYNTLWQLGTDHAGIATQMIVENLLCQEGKTRSELGREAFIERIWQWKEQSGNTIAMQQRRLGVSGDWTRERFTLDAPLVDAVQHAFIQLYNEDLIYRGKRLINWDPVLKTALSDLEVVSEECKGHLWYIEYPLIGSNDKITVATTRPETMLGDVAVAVNPKDERYRQLIGKKLLLPLVQREIPIIGDETVDQNFGSGCVKITPAHDFNDHLLGKKHQLPSINIFTKDAKINDNAPLCYQGLDRFIARQRIIADLMALGLLAKTTEHLLKIPRGERSGTIVEPYLTDQWFVRAKPLAIPAMEALHSGSIKFIPEHWGKTYLQWLENIEDWCISRQLWWGHRIPAWYDEQGKVYVGKDEMEVRTKFNLGEHPLNQDEDVLDTWFSAALWPFSTLGWPQNSKELATFYPTNTLVTGFDIIFFWVARMVMFGLKFTGQVPFKDIYITGLIRDAHGQKMSKSKGNILDPIDLADGIDLEQLVAKRTANLMQANLAQKIAAQTKKDFPRGISGFGIDALRFTFCSLATTSRDINFDMAKLEGNRNFCTKLWNCARFVLMQTENFTLDNSSETYSIADHWITEKLNETLSTVATELRNYRFDLATQAIYEFTWHQLCDWYLELVKPILSDSQFDATLQRGARKTLLTILEKTLRMIHPFMPFISEELWHQIAPKLGIREVTIMLAEYPQCQTTVTNLQTTMRNMEWLKAIIVAIRNLRGEINIAPQKHLMLLLRRGDIEDRENIAAYGYYIKWLAKIATLQWLEENEKMPSSAATTVGKLELHLVIDEADLQAELPRLTKALAKATSEYTLLTAKLQNQHYIAKAPAELVARDRKTLVTHEEQMQQLQLRLDKIRAMVNHG